MLSLLYGPSLTWEGVLNLGLSASYIFYRVYRGGSSSGASLVAQMVKNLPAMQKTRVLSLGQEDHMEKEMATHSSIILAWEIPRTEEPGGL